MNSKVNPGDRIAKILSRRGICSRREAEKLILQGKVRVNGTLISSPALNLQETDLITVNGKTVGQEQQTRLWRYHKPLDLVTSTKDEKGYVQVTESGTIKPYDENKNSNFNPNQMVIYEIEENFKDKVFDIVFCSGVLHHTKNPYGGFEIISKYVKKEGYIIIGLYNKFGRLRTKIRQII